MHLIVVFFNVINVSTIEYDNTPHFRIVILFSKKIIIQNWKFVLIENSMVLFHQVMIINDSVEGYMEITHASFV